MMVIPLGYSLLNTSMRPTRTLPPGNKAPCLHRTWRSYSVLLPVGFTLPRPLPVARWALTPPFHPCPASFSACHSAANCQKADRVVCFLLHFPWGHPRRALPGTVFPWSPDFPPLTIFQRCKGRPSSQLVASLWPVTGVWSKKKLTLTEVKWIKLHIFWIAGSALLHDPANPLTIFAADSVHFFGPVTRIIFQDRTASRTTAQLVSPAKVFHTIADVGIWVIQVLKLAFIPDIASSPWQQLHQTNFTSGSTGTCAVI